MNRTTRRAFLIALCLGLVSFLCAMAADGLSPTRHAWMVVTMRITGFASAMLLTIAIVWMLAASAIRDGEDPDDDR